MTAQSEDKTSVISNAKKEEPTARIRGLSKKENSTIRRLV
jgi:hypothetical protein